MEVVHEGWLLKSPPPKRFWKAKWRTRWFVLKCGDLPGQYFLEYYADESRKKLKGKIDLDECMQVDAGITLSEFKIGYKHMFDIQTPKRVYYLCANTEQEMNKWVDCVCQVCGLKAMPQENEMFDSVSQVLPHGAQANVPHNSFLDHGHIDSPPLSPQTPASTISGPYIPLATCISGFCGSTHFPFGDDIEASVNNPNQNTFSSTDMRHKPITSPGRTTGAIPKDSFDNSRSVRPSPGASDTGSSLLSPVSFEGRSGNLMEEDWPHSSPKKDGFPVDMSSVQDMCRSASSTQEKVILFAPPRPPKPPHLQEILQQQQNYQNLETVTKETVNIKNSLSVTNSDSHSDKCSVITSSDSKDHIQSKSFYSNSHCALSSGDGGRVSKNPDELLSPEIIGGDKNNIDLRASPVSQYTNIPNVTGSPPAVNRDLKPRNRLDSKNDISPSVGAPVHSLPNSPQNLVPPILTVDDSVDPTPPVVDRNLKPIKKICDSNSGNTELDPVPNLHTPDQRRRCAPSPTPPGMFNGPGNEITEDESVGSRRNSTNGDHLQVTARSPDAIQYLDLDLDVFPGSRCSPKTFRSNFSAGKLPTVTGASVVYKTVDFVKTEAFNKMRQNIEDSYRKNQ